MCKLLFFETNVLDLSKSKCNYILGGPNITANLYFICLSEHETCAYADAVQICGNIRSTQYNVNVHGTYVGRAYSEIKLTRMTWEFQRAQLLNVKNEI